MLVAGGGTGGHLFPGIAVAEEMQRRFPKGSLLFATTGRNIDNTGLGARGLPSSVIRCQGIKGRGVTGKIRSLLQLPVALLDAVRLLRRFRPDVVFGVGGYVTGPVLLAARLMGKATCIHEQNSVPGLTNRILGRYVDRIFLSIPGSERFFPADRTVMTGNPVRRDLIEAARQDKKKGPPTLLVLGGSQGAHRVNELVVGAVDKLFNRLPPNLMIIHQTGKADEVMVRDAYKRIGIGAEVAPFFHDMAACLGRADLVVSRAGATSLAELTVMGKPAILIPYPYAADDHQLTNARFLEEEGAAMVFVEKELTDIALGKELARLLEDADLRQRMAGHTLRLARPEAAARIVDGCLELLGKKKSGKTGAAAVACLFP